MNKVIKRVLEYKLGIILFLVLIALVMIMRMCFPFDKRSKYYPELAQELMDKQLSFNVGLYSFKDSVCALIMTDFADKRISVFKKGDKDKKWEAQYLNPSDTYCSSIACDNNLYIVVENEDGIKINRIDVFSGVTSNLFVADSSYSARLGTIWTDKSGDIYQTVENNTSQEGIIVRIDSNFVDVSFVRKIPFDTKIFNELGYDSVLVCRRLPEQDIALCYPKRERIIHELKDLRPIKATSEYLLFEKNNYHDPPSIIKYSLATERIDTVKVFDNLYSFKVVYQQDDCFVGYANLSLYDKREFFLSEDNCKTWRYVTGEYMASPAYFVKIKNKILSYLGDGIFHEFYTF